MQYVISFLEGIITFISPCLLPLLPVYLVYFIGDVQDTTQKNKRAFVNSIGFVCGFSILFIFMGAFAATLGSFLTKYQDVVNLVTGLVVILFGLNFIGILKIKFLNVSQKLSNRIKPIGFFSSVLFGIVFSVGWTPCVGAFLGSALMLASQTGSAAQGILMLVCYSLGLGIPFILSAVLIDRLKTAFSFIKKHYKIINLICGCFLVVIGVLMATGLMGRLLNILSFVA